MTRPTIVTVDGEGREERWGPLSRDNALRAGSFWENMRGQVSVFLEKDEKRKEVEVEKRMGQGETSFWFIEKKPESHQEQELREDELTPEEVIVMDEVRPEELEVSKKMWLAEKATTLEKENEELKKKVQEMEANLVHQVQATRVIEERLAAIERAISQIAVHIEQQNSFNGSARNSIAELVGEVTKHKDNFQEVVRVLQNNEQHMAKSGAASEEMAQYINALIRDNENKSLWIGTLAKEAQSLSQVIQQCQMGQQVLAEVMTRMRLINSDRHNNRALQMV